MSAYVNARRAGTAGLFLLFLMGVSSRSYGAEHSSPAAEPMPEKIEIRKSALSGRTFHYRGEMVGSRWDMHVDNGAVDTILMFVSRPLHDEEIDRRLRNSRRLRGPIRAIVNVAWGIAWCAVAWEDAGSEATFSDVAKRAFSAPAIYVGAGGIVVDEILKAIANDARKKAVLRHNAILGERDTK